MLKNEVDAATNSPEAYAQQQELALADNADVTLSANIPVFETVSRSQVTGVAPSSSRLERSALASSYAKILQLGGCVGC